MTTYGFETDNQGWGSGYGCTVAQTGADAHTGTGSLQTTTSSQYFGVYQAYPGPAGYTAGTSYDFSLWHKVTAGAIGSIALRVTWLDSAYTNLGAPEQAFTPGSGWAKATLTAVAPAGAMYGWIQLISSTGSPAGGDVLLVDDVVTETTPASGTVVNLGVASETDIARASATARLLALGRPGETDVVRAMSAVKRAALARVAETDAAQPAMASRSFLAALLAETDVVRGMVVAKRVALGRAVEVDAARGFTSSRIRLISVTAALAPQGRIAASIARQT